MLSDKAFAEAQEPLRPIPEPLAHPPTSGLLYRYWNEDSYGKNSETGFVAGRFMKSNLEPKPAPKCDDVDWPDFENHIHHKHKIASPFIS